MQPLSPEDRLGEYEILREVAQGATATVYEARSTHPRVRHLRVALRVLRDPRWTRHFMRVVEIFARLDHPRIPKIYSVDNVGGRPYSCHEFVDGDDVLNGLGRSAWDVEAVSRLAADVAAALDYAHGRDVIHGYVHPRHVIRGSDGRGWLIGFGEFPPLESTVFGNPVHLAPEQLEDRPLTAACDVYGLAETCYWQLSGGRHPFHEVSGPHALEAKRLGWLPRSLREVRPEVPVQVERVLLRALATDPADRYASPGEFATALAAAHRPGRRRWWLW